MDGQRFPNLQIGTILKRRHPDRFFDMIVTTTGLPTDKGIPYNVTCVCQKKGGEWENVEEEKRTGHLTDLTRWEIDL